ncbi:mitochondrial peptide methionine sulfoxide reductase [Dunckerocampus dactyliophorus]|uniref:mitochondrial peptide methionine sulfoxide reductase n=1 Tax=Dunckerocampus dactyliophorus TaxID=161453 RepID=UPI002406EF12|nr:mitochondrial peptide methionine sulfoxide reductase [Dunckerocampus dactyliophorus]
MSDKTQMPSRERALAGREEKMVVADKHAVNSNTTVQPFPEGMGIIMFGMGCFWGAEKLFWKLPGVFSTQVGFAGGFTPNPTYHEVCSGLTGHTEVVRVVFSPKDMSLEELLKHFWENHDPTQGLTGHTEVVRVVFSPKDMSLEELLKHFWENHDPTQGMKQHADIGTQYRSVIYATSADQLELALKSKEAYQKELEAKGLGTITTEILEKQQFYYAEDYHQQYLKKVPKGYCGLKGTGIACPIGVGKDHE